MDKFEPVFGGGKMDHSEEAVSQLIEMNGDGPVDFEMSEHELDAVPLLVERPVTATWERSVCRWMDGYWLFLVDLTTKEEEVSDLTLHAKLADASDARLEFRSVHVARKRHAQFVHAA